jgi:hypothetical protein
MCWSGGSSKEKYNCKILKKGDDLSPDNVAYSLALASTTFAIAAFFLTESIPFTQASLEEYASLTAMISPFAAFNRNLNFPFASLYHSKTGSGILTTDYSSDK